MTDITPVAVALKSAASGAKQQNFTAGESIPLGGPFYKNTTDNKVYKADNNATIEKARVVGIAMHPAAANAPVKGHIGGGLDLGATLTVGTIYVLSATNGICPSADLASGNYVTILGVATAANNLDVEIDVSDTPKA